MSWWISLHTHPVQEDGSIVDADGNDVSADDMPEVPHFTDGGTYVLGGTTEADLNVTYNYGKHFGFRALHRQQARDTIVLLARTVGALGMERSDDYWDDTEGNVGYCCSVLLMWALLHPDCYWRVD